MYQEKFGIEECRINVEGTAKVLMKERTHPRIVLTPAGGVVVLDPADLLTELGRTT